MIKIKSYRVQQQGTRGRAISLPKVWIDDLKLKPGDRIDFYRDEKNQLILKANRASQS